VRNKIALLLATLIITSTVCSQVLAPYWYDHVYDKAISLAKTISQPAATIDGKPIANTALTLKLPASQLANKIQSIITQPITLTVGNNTPINVSSATIKSWLLAAENSSKTEGLIVVNPTAVSKSILQLANQNVVAVVNSVNATEGNITNTIFTGTSGTSLANASGLAKQASADAKKLLSGNGFQLNAALTTAPSQVTPLSSMGKLLDVNVTTRRMYVYDNGQLVKTFYVTVGAQASPTPIGEFHIWEKSPSQTMSGYNPDGTKYSQPNVPWVMYFDHSGDAVYGDTYSSHGSVGLQVSQAEWLYNWSPIGTTVITHT
jgi:lipoprotein-anchoring transpeptidase ErfK/SrfK